MSSLFKVMQISLKNLYIYARINKATSLIYKARKVLLVCVRITFSRFAVVFLEPVLTLRGLYRAQWRHCDSSEMHLLARPVEDRNCHRRVSPWRIRREKRSAATSGDFLRSGKSEAGAQFRWKTRRFPYRAETAERKSLSGISTSFSACGALSCETRMTYRHVRQCYVWRSSRFADLWITRV